MQHRPMPSGTQPMPQRSRLRRVVQAVAWTLAGLLALMLALIAGAWWWLGTDQSLATTLAYAARYMPAGHVLETRDVDGSVRAGGQIGWLRYRGPSLAVEVQGARIGWQLAPLLEKRVELGELHADQVVIEPLGPPSEQAAEPLEALALPIGIDLPFDVGLVRWLGPPVLEARALSGRYRYADDRHQLKLDGVDIADGHYEGRVHLQGVAPMALDLALDARLRAPLAEGRSLDLKASAIAQGTLAGEAARIEARRISSRCQKAPISRCAPM